MPKCSRWKHLTNHLAKANVITLLFVCEGILTNYALAQHTRRLGMVGCQEKEIMNASNIASFSVNWIDSNTQSSCFKRKNKKKKKPILLKTLWISFWFRNKRERRIINLTKQKPTIEWNERENSLQNRQFVSLLNFLRIESPCWRKSTLPHRRAIEQ